MVNVAGEGLKPVTKNIVNCKPLNVIHDKYSNMIVNISAIMQTLLAIELIMFTANADANNKIEEQ